MREIKFRVWDLEDKNMVHINKSKVISEKRGDGPCSGLKWRTIKLRKYQALADFFMMIDASPRNYKIMQSTGLLDKNGEEIYEGDVVGWDFDKTLKTTIEFRWGCFGYKSFSSRQIKNSDDFIKIDENKAKSMKIEGNIFENPELLV